jgi:hypothetical protein
MKTVSKAQLRDGYIVQVTTDLPREQAVRKVMKTWGGQLAAMGVEPALLYSYAHGQERYKVTFATQGQFVLWMEVEPPAEHEPDRTTILDMGIQDLQLHTGIGGENLTPLKRAAQQINKAVKNLKVTNSQAIPPTDPSQTTADPITH